MFSRKLRGIAVSFALGLLAHASNAAEPTETIVLWPTTAPGQAAPGTDDLVLPARPNDNTIRLTNVTRPTLSVYRPAADRDTGAVALICPGGGYRHLAFNKEGLEVGEWLASIGVTGVVLKYRVPASKEGPVHAAALQDAQRAMGLIRERAKTWAADVHRVGVIGFSAGGHIAAALSSAGDERTYPQVDAADRESCRPDFALLLYPAYLIEKAPSTKLTPEVSVTANTPRTFLVMTQDDGLRVEGCLYYYLALKQAKISAELHVYPAGGHGYGLRPANEHLSTWPKRAEDWMKSQGLLNPPPAR